MPENPLQPQTPKPYEPVAPWLREMVTPKPVEAPKLGVPPPAPVVEEKPVAPVVDKPADAPIVAPTPAPAPVVPVAPPPVK